MNMVHGLHLRAQSKQRFLQGKRIAIVRMDVYTRGSDMMAHIVAQRLRDRGAEVSIFHGRGLFNSRFPLDTSLYQSLTCRSAAPVLVELAIRGWHEYDFVVADFAPLAWALGFSCRHKLVLLAQSHDVELYANPFCRSIMNTLCKTLMKRWRLPVMCSSQQLARRLTQCYGAVVQVIEEGEIARLFAFEDQARLPSTVRKTRPFAVMGIAGTGYVKGSDVLCQVFEHLDRLCGEAIEFFVAGQVQQWRFRRARMHYLGVLPPTRIMEIYRSTDVFVFTSRFENYPSPPFEAMLCGCPVVSTPVAEYLQDGVNSILASPEQPEVIASAVSRLLHDTSLRRNLVLGGQNTVHMMRDRLKKAATAADAFEKCLKRMPH